jgi:hypothetical protein
MDWGWVGRERERERTREPAHNHNLGEVYTRPSYCVENILELIDYRNKVLHRRGFSHEGGAPPAAGKEEARFGLAWLGSSTRRTKYSHVTPLA